MTIYRRFRYFLLFSLFLPPLACNNPPGQPDADTSPNYLQNRAPLIAKPYLELPLGSIKPKGWLLEQLERMPDGLTGRLDEIYPEVVGPRNGWLGGDGDGWERGPYWIDGLLPLAYILNDQALKEKVQPWIEWTLTHQAESGYLGPIPFEKDLEPEPGIQKTMRRDWWPKMVMLKVLQQYYNATQDERVVHVLTRYFQFQLQELENTPLDNWTFWANRRGGDNLLIVYWLYNITGDAFLLELGELIAEQTFPWTDVFLNEENYEQTASPWHYFKMQRYPFNQEEIDALTVSQWGGIHCVNLSQGLKQPLVYYQHDRDEKHYRAVKKALRDIKKYHGQPQGLFGGDEGLHGKNPVQGIEFCSISESMFSLETMLSITGDMEFAELLEKMAYNALPAQASDDFLTRQYFQAANQVQLTDQMEASYQTIGHQGTDYVFGTLSGYPCCTCNMHQSWPKFVQNLWYATSDGGAAALVYAPSIVEMKVGQGVQVRIIEETLYPFRDEVIFHFELHQESDFPFHLRIPAWTEDANISVNGEAWNGSMEGNIAKINRTWRNGDSVRLKIPMVIKISQWFDFTKTIERGPLVYSLKIGEEFRYKDRGDRYRGFYEVFPKSDWNYALFHADVEEPINSFVVEEMKWNGSYPWNLENVPVTIKARGIRLPEWKLSPGGLPAFPAWWGPREMAPEESIFSEITLVPYGCTTLRITEFPVYGLN